MKYLPSVLDERSSGVAELAACDCLQNETEVVQSLVNLSSSSGCLARFPALCSMKNWREKGQHARMQK